MAIKLGDMLVKSGLITQEQLEEALRNQVIFGGKLGTNLMELGYLGEEDIARCLSDKLSVPYVNPDQLDDIPAELIKLFPRELVERYRVVPLSLDKRKLTLVMSDPSDLAAIDEISFRTGFIIKPVISPEVRLFTALEKYYEIPRDRRYISVTSAFRKEWKESRSVTPPPPPVPMPININPEPETDDVIDLEIIEEPTFDEPGEMTLEALSWALVNAEDRDQIAETVLTFAAQELDGCALFLIRGNQATGWRGLRSGKPITNFETLQVSLDAPSVLQLVAQGKSFYLGPLASGPDNQMISAAVCGKPGPVCLVPLTMMGRVVSVLYADNGGLELQDQLPLLQKVMNKTAMAFEILILKTKVLQG
jgi:hypothetical protein